MSLFGSFVAFFILFTRGQLTAEHDAMGAFWEHTFPPLTSPLKVGPRSTVVLYLDGEVK